MMFKTVKYDFEENIATTTFDRPEALNALSLQVCIELRAAIERAIEQKARAIVLTGEGRAFCSGGDLLEMRSMWEKEGRIEASMEGPLKALHDVILLIRKTPIPFLASVNGVCAGAGTNFALACDLVIASDNASFNEGFIRIGLSPDCGGTFFLPRAVGSKIAAELFMTGESVSAARAKELGMINRVVPAEYLIDETRTLSRRLALAPTGVIGRIKNLLDASFSNGLERQLELEHQMQLESGRSADFKEGVAAFFEKRRADFTGA